jgi:alginate O-acetyltransferase complex protein AlgI
VSLTDFWRRWHITLSTFLRDYLYIPLGGNRKGHARTYINLFLVMFIGGLWHGAQWTFVIWGCAHGVLLALERAFRGRTARPAAFTGPLTFVFILMTWVLFRSENLEVASRMYSTMLGFAHPVSHSALLWADIIRPWTLCIMALAALLVWFAPRAEAIVAKPLTFPRLVGYAATFVLGIGLMLTQGENPFLYFQF